MKVGLFVLCNKLVDTRQHYNDVQSIQILTSLQKISSAEYKNGKWHLLRNWVFDGISKYRFIRTFCTILKNLWPFIFQIIKQNVFKKYHLWPYCTNIWQMCLMQKGHKYHMRPSCTNFWQVCVMQKRHKCHLRPSCIKQPMSLISLCFGFIFTFYTKKYFQKKYKDKLKTYFRYYTKYYKLPCVLWWKIAFVLMTLLNSDISTTVIARQS